MEQTRKNTDTAFTISGRLLASCAVAYMVLPTILFLLGWVRPLFSVPAAMAVAAASVLLCVKLPVPTLHFTRRQLAVYLCALLLSLLWLLAGGITGVALQHADFVVRNPIYETLIRCDWPLAEADGRHFIYYLAFWLPPALICKCFSWSDVFIVNYVLTAWIELGLALALTVLWGKFLHGHPGLPGPAHLPGPLDGVVRWSVHLFNRRGQTAHELYLTVLAFFGGVAPTMQLHYTFHHTTLLWLFLAMAVAWDIPPRHQLFLASLCLLASPIGSLGLLVFIAVRALVRRIPARQYFSSWTVLAGGALVLLAGIYFTSSNGNNRIRLTWEDSPFDLLRHGGWKFWGALAGSWLLTVGAPAVLLFRRFKKDDLFWTALAVLTLTYFIYIGSVGGYNEFCYKASSVSFFCLALLFTRIFAEPVGTRPWRACASAIWRWRPCPASPSSPRPRPRSPSRNPRGLPTCSVCGRATSTTRSIPGTPRYGAAEREPPSGPPISRKQGNPRTAPCAPFSTGMRTDAEPSAAPASRP